MSVYPTISPSYGSVDQTGGFHRYCYVLELLTLDKLEPAAAARLEDAIDMVVSKFQEIEKHDLVRGNRFTNELRRALHTS